MSDNAVIIFVKNLINGQVKTRLAATLGDEVAMDIYKQLVQKVHHTVQSVIADKLVFYSHFIEEDIWEKNLFQKELQMGNDLGERMDNAFKSSFKAGFNKLLLIGSDCPGIDETILKNAFANLDDRDIVIGPAKDGGYYLLGMKKERPYLFQHIEWGTHVVLQQTIDLCKRNHLSYFMLPELSDIDEENDLVHFKSLKMLNRNSS